MFNNSYDLCIDNVFTTAKFCVWLTHVDDSYYSPLYCVFSFQIHSGVSFVSLFLCFSYLFVKSSFSYISLVWCIRILAFSNWLIKMFYKFELSVWNVHFFLLRNFLWFFYLGPNSLEIPLGTDLNNWRRFFTYLASGMREKFWKKGVLQVKC